jgi:hypothetical protein
MEEEMAKSIANGTLVAQKPESVLGKRACLRSTDKKETQLGPDEISPVNIDLTDNHPGSGDSLTRKETPSLNLQ